MSLCVVFRTPDGGVLMAADTAVSTEIGGVRYRVSDMADEEKIISLLGGVLAFCSGKLEKCQKLRAFMRGMDRIDLLRIQAYAQKLFGHNTADDTTGILLALENGELVGMLSAQDFKIVHIPWDRSALDYFALGFCQSDAYEAISRYLPCIGKNEWNKDIPESIHLIGKVFYDLQCEGVGRSIQVYSRLHPNKPVQRCTLDMIERETIKKISKTEAQARLAHGVIKATDFLLRDGTSILTEDGRKISGDYIDAKGLNVVDDSGNVILSVDGTGIHWSSKYSPVKYQFAVSASGPWHDTMQANDKYRRDSLDGGTTWGDPYQFVGEDGKDGKNGIDARVPSYIKETKITQTTIESPSITGGTITGGSILGGEFCDLGGGTRLVLNPDGSSSGFADLNLYHGDSVALSIYDEVGGISISSYGRKFMSTRGDVNKTWLFGNFDFSNATVTGLKIIPVFG